MGHATAAALLIANGGPREAQALRRLLIVRVNGGSENLPTYRVLTPQVYATPSSMGATLRCANQVTAEPLRLAPR